MTRIRQFLVITLFASTSLALPNLPSLKTDQAAYEFCKKNTKSFIAVVWPIAQGKDRLIEAILREHGILHYKKSIVLSPQQALWILSKAHPQITDMPLHFAWYFPKGTLEKPTKVFLMEFSDPTVAIACKTAIRQLFQLQFRAIHINDTHQETLELAHCFFSEIAPN